MKAVIRAAAVMALVAGLSTPTAAQWPKHPSKNVPKTPTGDSDLNGPAPRTTDGKPGFAGLWRGVGSDLGGLGCTTGAAARRTTAGRISRRRREHSRRPAAHTVGAGAC